jgi:prepilin-type N-terminal cleavage/methylation domain-containing protein
MKRILARKPRRGLTLVEVIIAMSLLAGVLLSLGQFSAALARTAGTARLTAIGAQLVNDRLETVKGAPRYTAIESLYVKTETSLPGFVGFSRQTSVRRVGGSADTVDYKVITVEVSHSSLSKPVRKSTVMSVW